MPFKAEMYQPTQAEVDEHSATHLLFRSWCRFCVQGRRGNPPPTAGVESSPTGPK